ncbi:MAG TPA: hypothetical protein VHQ47_03935 [Phycisphaerae bacterium]|jgi:hypothetical protein|nr:hypothetical protein [Phycisphaerae bacterium]
MRDLRPARQFPLWVEVPLIAMFIVAAVLEVTHGQYFFFAIFALAAIGFGPDVVRRILTRNKNGQA